MLIRDLILPYPSVMKTQNVLPKIKDRESAISWKELQTCCACKQSLRLLFLKLQGWRCQTGLLPLLQVWRSKSLSETVSMMIDGTSCVVSHTTGWDASQISSMMPLCSSSCFTRVSLCVVGMCFWIHWKGYCEQNEVPFNSHIFVIAALANKLFLMWPHFHHPLSQQMSVLLKLFKKPNRLHVWLGKRGVGGRKKKAATSLTHLPNSFCGKHLQITSTPF